VNLYILPQPSRCCRDINLCELRVPMYEGRQRSGRVEHHFHTDRGGGVQHIHPLVPPPFVHRRSYLPEVKQNRLPWLSRHRRDIYRFANRGKKSDMVETTATEMMDVKAPLWQWSPTCLLSFSVRAPVTFYDVVMAYLFMTTIFIHITRSLPELLRLVLRLLLRHTIQERNLKRATVLLL